MKNKILYKVINKGTLLPNRVFNEKISFFRALEPTLIYDLFFFNKLIYFLKKNRQDKIIAEGLVENKEFILDIENLNYDYWINSVFSIDGLFYTETGITSESADWGLYIDNVDFEIGLVGFCNHEQEALFLNAFGEDRDIFMSLEDYIVNMDSILNFPDEIKEKYNKIIKYHTSPYDS